MNEMPDRIWAFKQVPVGTKMWREDNQRPGSMGYVREDLYNELLEKVEQKPKEI